MICLFPQFPQGRLALEYRRNNSRVAFCESRDPGSWFNHREGKSHDKGEELKPRPQGLQQGRKNFQATAVRVSRRKLRPPGHWGAQAPG